MMTEDVEDVKDQKVNNPRMRLFQGSPTFHSGSVRITGRR